MRLRATGWSVYDRVDWDARRDWTPLYVVCFPQGQPGINDLSMVLRLVILAW